MSDNAETISVPHAQTHSGLPPTRVIKPNFFIVGAAKCGTTSLHEYLRHHPEVFMCAGTSPLVTSKTVKEPYYFGRDLEIADYWTIRDRDQYLSLFAEAGDAKRVGEASVWSLLSTQAAREIKAFDPDAKIIVMLRNPVDMMYSLHGQFLFSGNEDIDDFEQALETQEPRRKGHRIPPTAHFPGGLQYTEVATLSPQVQRYFDVFGRDAVHVIIFDDFIADTAHEYEKTLRFLGVDPGFEPGFEVKNAARNRRNLQVRRFLKTRPQLGAWLGRNVPLSWRRGVGNVLFKVLKQSNRPKHMAPDLRQKLIKQFQPEVQRLSDLLGRDLTHWSRV